MVSIELHTQAPPPKKTKKNKKKHNVKHLVYTNLIATARLYVVVYII